MVQKAGDFAIRTQRHLWNHASMQMLELSGRDYDIITTKKTKRSSGKGEPYV